MEVLCLAAENIKLCAEFINTISNHDDDTKSNPTTYEQIQDYLKILSVQQLKTLALIHNVLYDTKRTAIREIAYAIFLKRTKQIAV